MIIKTLVWDDLPEFTLNTGWQINIINSSDAPAPVITSYCTMQNFNFGISDINIPQESLEFDKTSFGMPLLKGLEDYANISIRYFDYINTSIGVKLPITSFFQDWLDTLYDRDNLCVKKNWRKHFKNIQATLYRQLGGGATPIEIKSFEISHCYPVSLEDITLEEGNGDRREFSAELVCERVTSL